MNFSSITAAVSPYIPSMATVKAGAMTAANAAVSTTGLAAIATIALATAAYYNHEAIANGFSALKERVSALFSSAPDTPPAPGAPSPQRVETGTPGTPGHKVVIGSTRTFEQL